MKQKSVHPAGFEPATFGSVDRCSNGKKPSTYDVCNACSSCLKNKTDPHTLFAEMGKKATALIDFLLGHYALENEICAETLRQYEITVELFDRWNKKRVMVEELSEILVSRFLLDYAKTKSPSTVRSKRVGLLVLWRAATDAGLCREPVARKIRRVKLPERIVAAWSKDDVEKLLEAAKNLKRFHQCGLKRSQWFDVAIRVAWDTGLRFGDQIKLRAGDIDCNGFGVIVQSKTKKLAHFRLHESTLKKLQQSMRIAPRSLVTPWPCSHESFARQVKNLVKLAGVADGSWKFLRRGSGTRVELENPGQGHLHLGNTRQVFLQHYQDSSQLKVQTLCPAELD